MRTNCRRFGGVIAPRMAINASSCGFLWENSYFSCFGRYCVVVICWLRFVFCAVSSGLQVSEGWDEISRGQAALD